MAVQFGLVGLIISGMDHLLPDQVRENKFAAAILVWLVGNTISSGIKNSGAFEIYKGQDLVWSKLESGSMPDYVQLVEAFKRHGVDLEPR